MFAQAWLIGLVALAYVGILFAVAKWADARSTEKQGTRTPRPIIYSLSLAVYCTSWTYFGSVGVAARSAYDFIPVYLGPILAFAIGAPLISRIVALSKKQNVASIADFLAARYGKNQLLGGVIALIAVVGIIPYISIQLKALSFSLQTMMGADGPIGSTIPGLYIALLVTIALAVFAILFGTRHITATEHQDGMITAIAVESIIKLLAFTAVGVFVTFWLAGGPGELYRLVTESERAMTILNTPPAGGRWLTVTLLSTFAILLLPRQFHVAITENTHPRDIRRARLLFPAYLVAINIFVLPIAMAGLVLAPELDADTFVLALPVRDGNVALAVIAFIGGISAATAMVIVETIALAIMVSNNIVVPLMLRRMNQRGQHPPDNFSARLVIIRRVAICAILVLAYVYFAAAGNSAALAQTGLISFAAVAQFAPAFFAAILWKRGTAAGALAGVIAGFAIWAYTLLIPSFVDSGWLDQSLLLDGPFSITALRPRQLLGIEFDPLTHGVFWSLCINTLFFGTFSMLRQPTRIEQLQANAFVEREPGERERLYRKAWNTNLTMGELEQTVSRYLGHSPTRSAFANFALQGGMADSTERETDLAALRFAEGLLASAVGPSTSRLVLSLLLERNTKSSRAALQLLDDASTAVQQSREMLQATMDNIPQGVAVFDEHDSLISWNTGFIEQLDLKSGTLQIGMPMVGIAETLVTTAANSSAISDADAILNALKDHEQRLRFHFKVSGKTIEAHSSTMPGGGCVLTVSDVTESVLAANALAEANISLERRVRERTAELTQLNEQLSRAKAAADQANIGKTRFVAAASHDILQPLNAARLFTSTLSEKEINKENKALVGRIESSLEAVEDILSSVLDISRLDAGAIKPEIASFRIQDIFDALSVEFQSMATERDLTLKVIASSAIVKSDRKLLRRTLQNLLSNAIKYTTHGRIVMGVKRKGPNIEVQVLDTGPGIAKNKQKLIFQEFERLNQDQGKEPGLGLGLSIVDRMCKIMGHGLKLESKPGHGTRFAISMGTGTAAEVKVVRRIEPVYTTTIADLHILVIDNERATVDGLSALLTGWQMHVTSATTVKESVAAARANARIDMILADYHIHRDNGIDLIKRIRTECARDIPAVLITADRSRTIQEKAVAAGLILLRKPVKPAALRAALSQLASTLDTQKKAAQ